jgi:uncharacterized membrane protein
MIETLRTSSGKRFPLLISIFLIATALSILLDIPVLRQALGFAFFTIIPGLLVLYILKLNRIGLTEKLILSVGLSISLLMFAGLFINTVFPFFGYDRPLSTDSLLISFSVIILILTIVAYLRNQDASFINLSDFKLNTTEKAFLLIPVLFSSLSILGMHIMNTTDNNTMLMILLFLIPAYVIFIAIKHKQVPDRVYPPIILLTSISLVLLAGLRSNYILGVGLDIFLEYYLFRQTLYNGLWQILMYNPLDACLSISILPTIYQSLLNTNSQYLFKILYPILFSLSPLVVYIISRKYISNRYAFLASFFFMSQITFLWVAFYPRTSLAILFFALAIMTLLSDRLSELNKRVLFIIFAFSCIVSHYSTTYIFFFILLFTWLGMQIIPRIIFFQRRPAVSSNSDSPSNSTSQATATTLEKHQPLPKNSLTFEIVILFFVGIFFWYSQVTGVAFDVAVRFIYMSLQSLHEFFNLEAREGGGVYATFRIWHEGISWQIHFVFSWLIIAFIAIEVLATLARYYRIFAFSGENRRSISEFLLQKIDPLFFTIAFVCSAIFVVAVALPFVFIGYGIERAFAQMMIVLSPFFVIGGMEVARFLRVKRVYFVILIVLIPFFMCQTGTMHQIFGVPHSIVLNSEGGPFDKWYVHEEEVYAARWLETRANEEERIYADFFVSVWLVSQGIRWQSAIYDPSFIEYKKVIGDGYIFLRGVNVIGGKLLCRNLEWHNLTEYEHLFAMRNKIYDNGGSEMWR